MIHFYGAPMSSAGRTHWMLEEVGVPYEYHRVNVRDPAAMAEFVKVNPGGKIPYLIDGDVRLAESAAINFYLAETYKPELLPRDPIARVQALQWSFWALTNLQPESLKVMHGMMAPTDQRDDDAVKTSKERCQRLLDTLEAQLDTYLVGGTLSVADINAGSVVNLALRVNAATAGPKTAAWIEGLRARPAYKKATTAG